MTIPDGAGVILTAATTDIGANPAWRMERCCSMSTTAPNVKETYDLEFVAALPVTENGKVTKYKLRERGVTADTWDRRPTGRK